MSKQTNKSCQEYFDVVVIGGGAAGIFSAIQSKIHRENAKVLVLEKTAKLLSKVKISGGGRCNVTHNQFDPKELIKNYPRGHRELLGPFHQFSPRDTVAFFQDRGIKLKAEKDGRMFPISDSSETIIQTFMQELKNLQIEVRQRVKIAKISAELDNRKGKGSENKEQRFIISFQDGSCIETKKVILATGSSKEGLKFAENLGHRIITPVPSLFTFNVPSSPLLDLSGISLPDVEVQLEEKKYRERGPLLLTHFGFSGPAVLKLSAWGARVLFDKDYRFSFSINYLPEKNKEEVFEEWIEWKQKFPKNSLEKMNPYQFPKKLWKRFLELLELDGKSLKDIPNASFRKLSEKLTYDLYRAEGKTTNKEEFVTAGGVSLKEVNFKTMESKVTPCLFFAGEVLDIDGVTGGFNFQNAWTTAFLAALT